MYGVCALHGAQFVQFVRVREASQVHTPNHTTKVSERERERPTASQLMMPPDRQQTHTKHTYGRIYETGTNGSHFWSPNTDTIVRIARTDNRWRGASKSNSFYCIRAKRIFDFRHSWRFNVQTHRIGFLTLFDGGEVRAIAVNNSKQCQIGLYAKRRTEGPGRASPITYAFAFISLIDC